MMNRTILTIAAASVLAMIPAGCNRGMKVTFVNHTDKSVHAEFVTQGGPRDVGDIAPDKDKTVYVKFDEELLPAEPQFSITIDGGTSDSLTKLITIPKKPYKKLRVDIKSDAELGRVIEVHDQGGNVVK